ncbi:MAG: FprA family A-type flavoprotein [Culturomica sp.]|jgi:flavorubredoxin|nr:FprA family A-type flavoprotein [Culturomica sp.]
MKPAIEIKENIYWLGENDRRTHLFENYWTLPKGVAYNSYLVVDEKVALIDTIEKSMMDNFIEKIQSILGERQIDYLVINHVEPDHSGAIKSILCRYPEITLVGNCKTFPILKNFYGEQSRIVEVKDGTTLNIGKRELTFYLVPMVHWPETMVTYLPDDGVLFSADIFGSFGTLDGGIFDDQLDLDYLEEEISRYYSNIVGKYGSPAHSALRKLSGLKIDMICPTHGPVWRSYISEIVAKYEKWSCYGSDPGVVVVFSSMYGHTEKMADTIAWYLAEEGVKKIRIHDTSKTHPSYIINDIFRYKGVIMGSCAYNSGIFPTMDTLLAELENMRVKDRYVSFFANMSWVGGAIPRFTEFAERMKWEVVAPNFEISGEMPASGQDTCRKIARAMAEKL